jgi:hypothetical protein
LSKGKYRCAVTWEREYKDVSAIIQKYTTPAELKMIQHALTTNPNEALNRANCRRAPKDLFCAGTDSYKYRCAVTVGQVSVGHLQYYRRVFASLRMTLNPTTEAMFTRLDLNDTYNKTRKRSFNYKLKRSMAANKIWRNNLTAVRMDRAAGKGYGEKAKVVTKAVEHTHDKEDISKLWNRTPKYLYHIQNPVLGTSYILTYYW